MDLQSDLIESKKRNEKGIGKASGLSFALHVILIATFLYLGTTAAHKVDAEDKPIRAFITQGAAPPPPPPPPPPPAATRSVPKATPRVQPKVPTPVQQPAFVEPTEIPKELPRNETPLVSDLAPSEPADPSDGSAADALDGGVVGGVAGGVIGGEAEGVVGGELGGVKGGEAGGVVGGQVGGTGTGMEGEGSGGVEAPAGPVRVGGNVKAPVVSRKIEPEYTDPARNARVTGVVVLEAIIDKQGNVDQVRVLKGLPMGLEESAIRAVKQWKFRPGTLNGQPVDVIFSLTVNFRLG
jgi:protein TonB